MRGHQLLNCRRFSFRDLYVNDVVVAHRQVKANQSAACIYIEWQACNPNYESVTCARFACPKVDLITSR
jgi:hypothetical protein